MFPCYIPTRAIEIFLQKNLWILVEIEIEFKMIFGNLG